MKNKELHAIAQAAAKNIKTEADLNEFRQMLTKITVEAAKKWTMPIRNWKPALNRFIIEFEDRLTDYI